MKPGTYDITFTATLAEEKRWDAWRRANEASVEVLGMQATTGTGTPEMVYRVRVNAEVAAPPWTARRMLAPGKYSIGFRGDGEDEALIRGWLESPAIAATFGTSLDTCPAYYTIDFTVTREIEAPSAGELEVIGGEV